MDALDEFFENASNAIGTPKGVLKMISALLINYPLANIFIRLPKGWPVLKHVFNLSIATFYIFGLLKLYSGGLQLLGSAILTYVIARWSKSPNMPWIVFGIVMGHLFINHIYRTLANSAYTDVDITGPQMVLTLKLTSFAWNDKLQSAIKQMPSLLAFLGYAFYFPACLVGHSSDMNTYTLLTEGKLFDDNAKEEDKGRHVPRGRKRVAYGRGLMGLLYLGMYSVMSPFLNYQIILKPQWVTHGVLARIITVQFIGFIERTKYYGVWKLTEGACIVTGLGFSGYDVLGRSTWDGIANVNIPWIEFAPNFKILLDSWNIRTNIWLRECVYKRVTPAGKKPGFQSTMLTFTTSAIWHGTYSGYYLTFFYGGFVQTSARLVRTNLRPLFLSPLEILPPKLPEALAQKGIRIPPPPRNLLKRIYDILGTVASALILNFSAAPFMLWYWSVSLEGWRRVDWYGIWMVGIAFAFFYGGGAKVCKKWREEREKKASRELAEDIVSGENYTHATLRTGEMKGTGLAVVPPVDEVIKELEDVIDGLVEKLKAEGKLKRDKVAL